MQKLDWRQLDWMRIGFIADGVFFLALACGFAFRISWVTWLWPWLDRPIATTFVAALLASYGAGSLLIARLGEWRAAVGGSLAVVIAVAGFVGSVAFNELLAGTGLIVHAAVLTVIAAIAGGTLVTCLNSPAIDPRPIPGPVRLLFLIFAPLLFLSGIALLLRAPAVLFFPLSSQTSLLFGWVFVGFSVNFAYIALRANLTAAHVLLFGFLIYDALLIVPLVGYFSAVGPEHWSSLMINTCVVVFTAAVAVYYLFVDREARVRMV